MGNKMNRYLQETAMLDFSNPNIQKLIEKKAWKEQNEFDCLKGIYNFVRDDILFGYNVDDNIPASKVLEDGYGQCNTKGTLFMALLRACKISCRVHGFTIDKQLQKKFADCDGSFCGYGVAVKNFQHPIIDFDRNNTYIQSEGIKQDFGVYDSPDELQKSHYQETSAIKAFIYRNLGRHLMNRNVKKIRNS